MIRNVITIALVLVCASAITAQVIVPGSCPTVQVKQGFEVGRYTGIWYEARKYFAVFQAGATCARAEYTQLADGTIKVNNTETRGGLKNEIIGSVIIPDASEPAKLLVNFPQQGPNLADYWVLDTDYDSYAVVWSCTQFGSATARFAWVLTRAVHAGPYVDALAQNVLTRNNIDLTPIRETLHDNNCVNY